MVLTPSLGVHVYFAYDGDDIHPAVGWRPFVDIRAAGSYVVSAGSVTDVGVYEVIDDRDPAPLPDWLRDLLVEETKPGTKGAGHEPTPGKYADVVQKFRK
jgi:hypothetical protein